MHPNDPALRSFIDVEPNSDFPIQNLPYGIFSTEDSPSPRMCVAIGEYALDLHVLQTAGLIGPADVFSESTINAFMALGPDVWSATRACISDLLRHDNPALRDNATLRARALRALNQVRMHLPIRVSGFTDFYSSREHATNVGTMFRGKENALSANWLQIPIGYNGRASTVVVSGTEIRRPCGQTKGPSDTVPSHGPCQRLDFELEIGTVIGQSSAMGTTLGEKQAEAMIFGFVLLNDWSARDIQQWEYVPLGPFQAKAFATSIGPWVVTRAALEPFRIEGPAQSPRPLPYLHQTGANNYDIALEVTLRGSEMKDPATICSTNFKHMYWSPVQQLVHHASCGCAMEVGDLLGSGTISGPGANERGSMLELSWNGADPIKLAPSVERSFLIDGDSVAIRGHCAGENYRIGFGEVEGTILSSLHIQL